MTKTDPTLRALEHARALIARPDNWTTDYMARDADGGQTSCLGTRAVQWCLLGAVDRALFDIDIPNHAAFSDLRHILESRGIEDDLGQFNDAPSRTHAEVLELFDAAIWTRRRLLAAAEREDATLVCTLPSRPVAGLVKCRPYTTGLHWGILVTDAKSRKRLALRPSESVGVFATVSMIDCPPYRAQQRALSLLKSGVQRLRV